MLSKLENIRSQDFLKGFSFEPAWALATAVGEAYVLCPYRPVDVSLSSQRCSIHPGSNPPPLARLGHTGALNETSSSYKNLILDKLELVPHRHKFLHIAMVAAVHTSETDLCFITVEVLGV